MNLKNLKCAITSVSHSWPIIYRGYKFGLEATVCTGRHLYKLMGFGHLAATEQRCTN
jgi:hypothetical protein